MIYKPPYQITDEMLILVSKISEKLTTIKITQNLDNKPELRKNNKIQSIHSSLAIEANSLSLENVKNIINGKLVIGDRKEIQEVKNAYEAYEMISSINPFSIDELKKIHAVMTKYLLDDYGEFRKGNEGVFDGEKCIFMAPPPKLVPLQMQNLFAFISEYSNKIHPLILSAIFHYEFVFIHPFSDGNGRMARLWHTILLYKWNKLFEYIPFENQIKEFQQDYYEAIANCHANGNSNDFIAFSLQKIDEILSQLTC